MVRTIFPGKLKKNSHIRVVSPARSLSIISSETRDVANKRFEELGITISFSKNAEEMDAFGSSSIQSRVEDLHEAFSDSTVDGILTTIGGYNSTELLDYLDYDLIRSNPKILCGFSDITALAIAIYHKTGLVTYSGTHYSSWGMRKGFEYSHDFFAQCLMQDKPYTLHPASEWSDDPWYINQEDRKFISNSGYKIINPGTKDRVSGKIIGGNLGLLNTLQGTQYFPDLNESILFLEHCAEDHEFLFNRGIQSLIHQDAFKGVQGIVIGRFQPSNNMNDDLLSKMILSKQELKDIPVISGVDFGHTTPIVTFPIGGCAEIEFSSGNAAIHFLEF